MAAFSNPIDLNVEQAFNTLVQEGKTEKQAIREIRDALARETNFDTGAAIDSGVSDEEIIAFLVGRDADDLEPSRLRSFGRGVASGLIQEGTTAAAGVASYKAAGLAGRFLTNLARGLPSGTPYTFLAKAGLGVLGAGLTAVSDIPEETEEALIGKRPLLPSERGFARSGEVLGGTLGYVYPTRKLLQKLPEDPNDINLGSRFLMQNHLRARNSKLKGETVDVDTLPKTPKRVKAVETLEKIVAGAGRSARERGPLTFSAGEVSAATLPAITEGLITEFAPGRDDLALIGGLTAAFVPSPVTMVATGVGAAGSRARQEIQQKGFVGASKDIFGLRTLGERKRQQQAGAYLIEALRDAGEDPDVFFKELQEKIAADPDLAATLTPGQLTNHPVILLAEKTFAQGRPDLTNAQKDAARKGAVQMTLLIESLKKLGTPEALREAGKLEREAFENLLIGGLDKALYNAAAASDRIIAARGPENITGQMEASEIVANAADQALETARKFESDLYGKIDQTMAVDTTPILQAFSNLMDPAAEGGLILGSGDPISSALRNYLKDFGYTFDAETDVIIPMAAGEVRDFAETDSLGNLLAFRRMLQRELRAAGSAAEPINKAIYGPLDQAALEAVGAAGARADMTPTSLNIRQALDFSRQLNDVFLRSFTGDLTRKSRRGKDIILPEDALDRLFTGGYTKQKVNLEAMKEAFGFVDELGDTQFKGTVNSAVDFYIRNIFEDLIEEPVTPLRTEIRPAEGAEPARVIDTLETGEPGELRPDNLRINPQKLRRFLNQNKPILQILDDEFNLLNDLDNVETAQVALETAFADASQRAATNRKQVSLAMFLNADNSASVLANVLASPTAKRGIRDLAKRIKESPDPNELKDGLYATLIDHVISEFPNKFGSIDFADLSVSGQFRPGEGKGGLDFERAFEFLFNTDELGKRGFQKGQGSVMTTFLREGLVEKEQVDKLRSFLLRGRDLQRALDRGVDDFINVPESDAMKDLVSRIAGAQGIAMLMRTAGLSPTIQTTGAGAQFIKNQFATLPTLAFRDILVDVTKPGASSLLADFLQKGRQAKDLGDLNPVYKYIGQFILGSPSYVASTPFRDLREDARPLPPAPPPQAVQPVSPPVPGPQPAALQGPVPQASAMPMGAPSAQRQRFAALYPDDPVSPLIQAQGIATLPVS